MRVDPTQLRKLRIRHGLSMRELARQSGLSVGTVSLIERGKSPGSPATAKALADALDVSVDDLWLWEE